jgi:hypothetical protein
VAQFHADGACVDDRIVVEATDEGVAPTQGDGVSVEGAHQKKLASHARVDRSRQAKGPHIALTLVARIAVGGQHKAQGDVLVRRHLYHTVHTQARVRRVHEPECAHCVL